MHMRPSVSSRELAPETTNLVGFVTVAGESGHIQAGYRLILLLGRQVLAVLYKTTSAAVYGIDANLIEVEVDICPTKAENPQFTTVGLPDAAVRESRERVRSALKNSGYDIPPSNTTINLAPADLRKEGSGFDLPMALGILGAYGGLRNQPPEDALFVGELSLDGGLRGFVVPSPLRSRRERTRSRSWCCRR